MMPASREHAQLMTQDQHLASSTVTIAAEGEQTKKPTDSKVEERQQHSDSGMKGWMDAVVAGVKLTH